MLKMDLIVYSTAFQTITYHAFLKCIKKCEIRNPLRFLPF